MARTRRVTRASRETMSVGENEESSGGPVGNSTQERLERLQEENNQLRLELERRRETVRPNVAQVEPITIGEADEIPKPGEQRRKREFKGYLPKIDAKSEVDINLQIV